ncbi:MAG: hypothetical protein QXR53_04090 [Candidatus Norongarragalinales archaeon]
MKNSADKTYFQHIKNISVQFAKKPLSNVVFGPSPPNVFIGRAGYPNVFVGPLVSVDETIDPSLSDSPAKWTSLSYEQIIELRASMARGMKKHAVKHSSALLEEMQLGVLAQKPVDMEVTFTKKPQFHLSFSAYTAPMGPAGAMETMRLTENPVIPKKVDELAEEKIKVRDAIPELVKSGFDYYYMQKLLSAGVLGEKKKLVPTRWSITGTDTILADHYLEKVKESSQIDSVMLYSHEHFDNHYEILLLPGAWEFEQFEAWSPGSDWKTETTIAHEYEPFEGRSDYAESEGGGYYAGRFGVAEALWKMRRQARSVVFREISEDYKVPLGVWQVRTGVEGAFKKQPLKFASAKEALEHLKAKLKVPVENYLAKSSVLRQKTLSEF